MTELPLSCAVFMLSNFGCASTIDVLSTTRLVVHCARLKPQLYLYASSEIRPSTFAYVKKEVEHSLDDKSL